MIVVIGNTTVDVLVPRDPEPSPTVGDGFTPRTVKLLERPVEARLGGNGANSAAALAVLGREVALVSGVGRDAWGELIVGWLRALGVDLDRLVRAATSGVSILETLTHDRHAVLHAPCRTGDAVLPVEPDTLLTADGVLLTGPQLVADNWRASVVAAANAGRRTGLWALDVGPILGAEDPSGVAELLGYFDVILGNDRELCAVARSSDWERAARRIHRLASAPVVVKQGAAGATVVDGDVRSLPLGPGSAAEPRTAAGAGDAFDAALLSALLRRQELDDAVADAQVFAGRVLRTHGGVTGLSQPALGTTTHAEAPPPAQVPPAPRWSQGGPR